MKSFTKTEIFIAYIFILESKTSHKWYSMNRHSFLPFQSHENQNEVYIHSMNCTCAYRTFSSGSGACISKVCNTIPHTCRRNKCDKSGYVVHCIPDVVSLSSMSHCWDIGCVWSHWHKDICRWAGIRKQSTHLRRLAYHKTINYFKVFNTFVMFLSKTTQYSSVCMQC